MVWCVLDLETTGLDPREDMILECAAGIVDPQSLEVLDRVEYIVWGTPAAQLRGCMNETVLKMHTDNALLSAISALQVREDQGDQSVYDQPEHSGVLDHRLSTWLKSHLRSEEDKVILIGNSIASFDRNFIANDLPKTFKLLHHRTIDVSGYREACLAWGIAVPEQDKAHRAWADCMMSLGTLRWMQKVAAAGSALLLVAEEEK